MQRAVEADELHRMLFRNGIDELLVDAVRHADEKRVAVDGINRVPGQLKFLHRAGELIAGFEQDLEQDGLLRRTGGDVIQAGFHLLLQCFFGNRRRFAVPAFEVGRRELEDAEAGVGGKGLEIGDGGWEEAANEADSENKSPAFFSSL